MPIQRRFAVLKGQLYFAIHHLAQSSPTLTPHWVNRARRIRSLGAVDIPAQAATVLSLYNVMNGFVQNAQSQQLTNQWWTRWFILSSRHIHNFICIALHR